MFPAARRCRWLPYSALYAVLACAALSVPDGLAAAGDPPPAPALPLTPCTLPKVAAPARCGTLEVAENPARPEGRRLALKIVVIPARSGKSLPDPVVFLSGGREIRPLVHDRW